MFGILLSFWEGPFSGAMLVSGRVFNLTLISWVNSIHLGIITQAPPEKFHVVELGPDDFYPHGNNGNNGSWSNLAHIIHPLNWSTSWKINIVNWKMGGLVRMMVLFKKRGQIKKGWCSTSSPSFSRVFFFLSPKRWGVKSPQLTFATYSLSPRCHVQQISTKKKQLQTLRKRFNPREIWVAKPSDENRCAKKKSALLSIIRDPGSS